MLDLFTFDYEPGETPPSSQPQRPKQTSYVEPRRDRDISEWNRKLEATKCRKIQRVSQMSRESLLAKFMALDPIAQDAFEERAAILEFDAGLSRDEAERRAFEDVIRSYSQS